MMLPHAPGCSVPSSHVSSHALVSPTVPLLPCSAPVNAGPTANAVQALMQRADDTYPDVLSSIVDAALPLLQRLSSGKQLPSEGPGW